MTWNTGICWVLDQNRWESERFSAEYSSRNAVIEKTNIGQLSAEIAANQFERTAQETLNYGHPQLYSTFAAVEDTAKVKL